MDIIKRKNTFFIVSLAIILLGIIFMITSSLNFGIDFTGGTLLQINLDKKIPVSEVREITDSIDKDADIIHAGDEKHEIIIKTAVNMNHEDRMDLFSKFKAKYNLKDDALVSQKKFGPAIGEEIRNKALIAIIIATLGMLLYITFRFELNFGVSAVVALIHDILIALAVYAIFRLPVNSSFVAAMLTIVGYSINDTIVVFDRIRENLKKMRKDKYEDIINKSISQTIVRSLNTSFTTLLAITCLYVFGVEAIKDFALPLIVGVLVGTYSSIFIASPVWYLLRKRVSTRNNYNPNKV
ncbi:MAG: protein translocase subunit SecF [Firmicutes bacterium]|nr:protein translocase subunit SecF [Bacillota bacterium]